MTPSTRPLGFRHPMVQQLRKYIERRKDRDVAGVFVVEGYKLVREGIDSGAAVKSIFVGSEASDHQAHELASNGAAVHRLEPGVIERVASTVSPQGVIAVFEQVHIELDDAETPVVVLCDVRDPGNAGTIVRSAEAAGVGAVIFADDSVDVYNPKVIRSSAGAVFHVGIVRQVASADVADQGWINLGTTMDAPTVYDEPDLTAGVALYFGNEANGLDDVTIDRLDDLISIPIAGRSESLNVSMAAAIICFEYARQRRHR